MTFAPASLKDLARALPPGSLLTGEGDLLSYSYDGALDRARPDAVVLASTAEDVRQTVRWCGRHRVPFIARGAGTNLSGGCVALKGGVVISLAKLDRILEVDTERGIAVVEPGVVNLNLQKELEKVGRFYAPDPASFRVCTLGGNVSENAGGPRCLKYGVTSNHVLALEVVLPDGTVERFSADDAGPGLSGLFVGAEGTLGIVTKAWLRTLPAPETIRTLLAGFGSIEASIDCVSAVISAGILPRVLEALDRTTVESVEAYCHAGYPKTEAVLLIELDGPAAQVDAESKAVEELCRRFGAVEQRQASDVAERDRLWEGRRGAYAAVARIAPNVLVEDGVVPRGKLPEAVRRVRKICDQHRIKVAMLFHAGDGNLHPNIAYDERNAEETARVRRAGREILRACVELGGSISGEHGIGIDKREAMAWLFSPETLGLFGRLKTAFDPDKLANPEKLFPEPKPHLRPLAERPLTPAAAELVGKVRDAAAKRKPILVHGSGSRYRAAPGGGAIEVSTTGLKSILEADRANFTATVEAGIALDDLQDSLKAQGFYLPKLGNNGTLGGAIACRSHPDLRDLIIGMRAVLASGEVVEFGGKVMKNVAGYEAAKLVIGSWGSLAVVLEVTLKLFSSPMHASAASRGPGAASKPFTPTRWHRRVKTAFDPDNRLNPWVFAR